MNHPDTVHQSDEDERMAEALAFANHSDVEDQRDENERRAEALATLEALHEENLQEPNGTGGHERSTGHHPSPSSIATDDMHVAEGDLLQLDDADLGDDTAGMCGDAWF